MWERERGKIGKLSQNGNFYPFFFFANFDSKHPHINQFHGNLTILRSSTQQVFYLPLIDRLNGLSELKVVESTIFEIMGVGTTPSPTFLEGMGTKYHRRS